MALRPQAAAPLTTNGAGNGGAPPRRTDLVRSGDRRGAGACPVRSAAEVQAVVARAAAPPTGPGRRCPWPPAWTICAASAPSSPSRADETEPTLPPREMGKHPTEALLGDVLSGLMHLDYAIRQAPRLLRPQRVRHGIAVCHALCRGRAGAPRGDRLISPYNYPVLLTANTLFMALAAGNVVVAKPSEHTPLTVLKLAEICTPAGLPADVFQVVTGDGDHGRGPGGKRDRPLVFVGGAAAGRKIAAAAGARLLAGDDGTGRQQRDDRARRCGPGDGRPRCRLGRLFHQRPGLRARRAGAGGRGGRRPLHRRRGPRRPSRSGRAAQLVPAWIWGR